MTENIKIIHNEEELSGDPLTLESVLKVELANQLLQMGASNYENICENMRKLADVFEIIEENINAKYMKFLYNPMGNWYLAEVSEDLPF